MSRRRLPTHDCNPRLQSTFSCQSNRSAFRCLLGLLSLSDRRTDYICRSSTDGRTYVKAILRDFTILLIFYLQHNHFALAPMSLERESDGLGCLDFIPSPLLSEISLLDACNRLCSRIITQFGSRELSSSKGRNDMPFGYGTQQPNLLGEYFQQGVGTFWLNAQTAMPPVHISAIGPSVVPHDDRFGGGANLFPVHFPYNEEAGGGVLGSAFDPHHPMLSSGVAVPGWNAHALEHLDRNRQMNLQRENTLTDTSLGRAKKRKELPVCMIYSCTSISEPCKRKLKLCSEHKVRTSRFRTLDISPD